MDGCENPPCCLQESGGAENFLQKNWGRIRTSPDKELCGPVPEYKLASISLLLTPLSLHCFLLLPGNLQLELSHGDGNQMRGIPPAAGAAAAREWDPVGELAAWTLVAAGTAGQYSGHQCLSVTHRVLSGDLVSESPLPAV